jgi:chromosome segregation ATPase
MAMRRADRKNPNDDNAANNPQSRKKEPTPPRELEQLLMTIRAQRDQWQQKAKDNEEVVIQAQQEIETYQNEINELRERAAQSYQIYQNEQTKYQQSLSLYNKEQAKATELISQRNEWEQRAKANQEAASQLVQVQQNIQTYGIKVKELEEKIAENYLLYLKEQDKSQEGISQLIRVQKNIKTYEIKVNELKEIVADEKQNYQQTLSLYNEEKAKAIKLLVKYEEINSERDKYVILYNEAKAELKFERRSKASIKGWETRRKAENERLKKEISDMVVLLRQSLTSKDEAINNLYIVAERMDRIQSLVDSVEEETTNNPVGMVQKFKRIWSVIKEILSE